MRRAWIGIVVAACSSHPGGGPSPPDASSTTTSTRFVDPALGTDDLQHGTAPGAGAWKTITFALAHATAVIQLADGTYDHAGGETFPLTTSSGQQLIASSPLGAHVVGDNATATITLGGDGDELAMVDVTTTVTGADAFTACVSIATDTQHAITGANLHGCFAAIEFGGHGHTNVTNVTTGDVANGPTAGNCLNQAGDDVHLMSFSCKSSNDWVFGCGASFTGCASPVLGRQAACQTDTSHFADPCI